MMHNGVYSIQDIQNIIFPIAKQHGVDRVYLFGSYARGEATDRSDIDLFIDAAELRGMFALSELHADLSEALNKSLDLVTAKSLKYNTDKRFLENLRKEQVLLYEHDQ